MNVTRVVVSIWCTLVPPPPAAPGYSSVDPNQNRAGGVAYGAPPPPVAGQVGYPPPIGKYI